MSGGKLPRPWTVLASEKLQDCRVFEVGISYDGRKYEDGKKINWTDAVWALFCIFRYRFFKRVRPIDWSLVPTRSPREAVTDRPESVDR